MNELIKRVKKHEVRSQAKVLSARRAMESLEFLKNVKICRKIPENNVGRYTGATYFLSWFHMIAMLDDVKRINCKDLTANMEYPYTLKSKMRWSKNILGERESPDLIIIGSIDPNYCVILVLSLHLEHSTLEINQQDI